MGSSPRRKPTVRLVGHDYRQAGAYFVTITVQGMACLFGEVVEGDVVLSVPGLMVESWWADIGTRFPTVTVGTSIVMPNHLHGILWMGEATNSEHGEDGGGDHAGSPVRVEAASPFGCVRVARRGHPASRAPDSGPQIPSLSEVVGWFETMTTNDYIRGVKDYGFVPFAGRLWHRTFHDHVIRNDADLDRIQAYIVDNPRPWAEDELNPAR